MLVSDIFLMIGASILCCIGGINCLAQNADANCEREREIAREYDEDEYAYEHINQVIPYN